MSETVWTRRARYAALLLLAGGTLLLELGLTRILSVALWYHFAFLVVATALLGLAAGGVIVGLWPDRFPPARLPLLTGLGALSTVLAIVVFLRLGHLWDRLIPGLTAQTRDALTVAAAPLVFLVPFVCVGLGVSALLTQRPTDASRLYASDLLGAGLACLAFVPLMESLGGPRLVLATGVVLALAGVILAAGYGLWRRLLWLGGLTLVLGGLTLAMPAGLVALRYVKGHAEAGRPLYERWNAFSRIAVFPSELPDRLVLTIDANASTDIFRAGAFDRSFWQTDIRGLPYLLRPGGHALIIGPGGGGDITAALALGQRQVTAVELNPLIVEAANTVFAQFSGRPYQQPGVVTVVDDGRSFIARSTGRYDTIVLTFVDTWAATAAGAFALAENNLYTREAFRLYLERLTDDGVFVASRWFMADHPQEMIRLTVLARTALEDLGLEPASRVAVLRRGDFGLLYVKREPFTRQEIDLLRTSGAEPYYLPGLLARPPFPLLLRAPSLRSFLANYPYDVSPPSDDRPFFFQMTRLQSLQAGLLRWREGPTVDTLAPVVVLLAALGGLLVALTMGLGLPLMVASRRLAFRPRADLPLLGYFAALGLGFMLIEIVILQRFTLLLGQPTYSLVVTLFTLLLSAALGSLLTRRVSLDHLGPALLGRLGLLLVWLVGAMAGLLPLLHLAVARSLPERWLIAVVLLAPAGVVMGGFLPLGLRALGIYRPALVPWAWGVNGATSVLGSVLALTLGIFLGFTAVLALAALVYAAAPFLLQAGLRALVPTPADWPATIGAAHRSADVKR